MERNSINSTNLINAESTTQNLFVSSEVKLSDEWTNKNKDHPFTSVSMKPIITPIALPVTMQVTDIYLKNTGFGKAV